MKSSLNTLITSPFQDSRSEPRYTRSSRLSFRCVCCGAAAGLRATSRSATRSSTKFSQLCRTNWSLLCATASYSISPETPDRQNNLLHLPLPVVWFYFVPEVGMMMWKKQKWMRRQLKVHEEISLLRTSVALTVEMKKKNYVYLAVD